MKKIYDFRTKVSILLKNSSDFCEILNFYDNKKSRFCEISCFTTQKFIILRQKFQFHGKDLFFFLFFNIKHKNRRKINDFRTEVRVEEPAIWTHL